ncbi:MAG TPA: N-acetylmuramoyl-L-alanine amidase [Acidobacteriaceae bacterium]|nr:N-acetylmuramoyl-L-alanine amidase [Acidobacteriaceae bacterium]
MPASPLHAGRLRLLMIAGLLCVLGGVCCFASTHRGRADQARFKHAERLREALEGRPEAQRTRGEYERVMNAYRVIYHTNPASPYADASVTAVADLLAEEGRVFEDDKALHDAIGQYTFLRTNYPRSQYRYSALLTIGEIYLRDLNDPVQAKATFEEFLRLYPQSGLANEARIELRNLRVSPHQRYPHTEIAQSETRARTTPHESVVWQKAVPAAREAVNGVTETDLNAPPPPLKRNHVPLVTGIRYWSTPVYTRVAIDLEKEVRYEAIRVGDPDRIFFDLYGARLSPVLSGKSDQVIDDGFLRQIHASQFSENVARIVLNVSDISEYSAFFLPNPPRLIIDVHGSRRIAPMYGERVAAAKTKSPMRHNATVAETRAPLAVGLGPETQPANRLGTPVVSPAPKRVERAEVARQSNAADVDSQQGIQDEVRATQRPTMGPVVQSVAGTTPAPQIDEVAAADAPATPRVVAPTRSTHAARSPNAEVNAQPATVAAPQPAADGEPTMVRALGLKINRIVIDPGHGGHDSGTVGPGGIEEKNVALDVALRLGALLKQKLGADVIYTRDDDTFIPLETRTAIANKAQADLFISIHANSSPDPAVRGVEVYYLNFTTSADALEVAARENAVSDQSIHELGDLVRKIALQSKIDESRAFAEDVDQSLYDGLEAGNPGLRNRGVKKAPFVVLIGANMPSILAEISFLSNPESADDLRQPQYRERIAEALYRGVARYVDSLNGVRLAQVSPHGTQ